uniref:Cerebral peptide prohormone like-1 n=1 Tax=Schmidtea mediterranea TaxID=79327 RepID=E3CTI7_SCHMD|nr:TPA_inf: cerebral peptide prohormone like-1 [Schmidtea mediterranea]
MNFTNRPWTCGTLILILSITFCVGLEGEDDTFVTFQEILRNGKPDLLSDNQDNQKVISFYKSKRVPGWGKRSYQWIKKTPGWGKRTYQWSKKTPGWG